MSLNELKEKLDLATIQSNRALSSLIFLAEHLRTRPSGALGESDGEAIVLIAKSFLHSANDEEIANIEYGDERLKQERKLAAAQRQQQAMDDFKRRQQAAHSAVAAALVSGALTKSTQCERCPVVAENTIAHHHDYDKPLDVEWLCRPCHGKHHAEHGPAL